MENLKDRIAEILNKPEWTDKEKQWLLKYLENTDAQELRDYMGLHFKDQGTSPRQVDPEISAEILQDIQERIRVVQRVNKARVVKWWILKIAAASCIGILSLSTYLWFKNDTGKEIAKTEVNNKPYKNLSFPGKTTVLTLADGSTIALDNDENGVLTKQGNTKLLKVGGKLVYNAMKENGTEILYNKVTTPVGGQYQIELPDGSQVWLNAASSLYFPTSFAGKEKWVELMGEAYFEIAKSPSKPFKVKVNGAEVQVLGTHFNIMAYEDEAALKTTLLEGEVKFVKGSYHYRLKPGQQTQLAKNGGIKVVSGVNVAAVVAWKNGIFDFEGADIASVAGQLSRWYDVEIVFDKEINDLFYARIARGTKLADVLKALELTGKVKFEIDGKKIIVKS